MRKNYVPHSFFLKQFIDFFSNSSKFRLKEAFIFIYFFWVRDICLLAMLFSNEITQVRFFYDALSHLLTPIIKLGFAPPSNAKKVNITLSLQAETDEAIKWELSLASNFDFLAIIVELDF